MPKTIEQAIAESKARTLRLEEKARKHQTRRKVVLGAWLISKVFDSRALREAVIAELQTETFRPQDEQILAAFREDLHRHPAEVSGTTTETSRPSTIVTTREAAP
jgi:hypothetical protein